MESELRTLFYTGIEAFGSTEGVGVEMPAVHFEKPSGANAVYLQASTLGVLPAIHNVAGGARHTWLLQVSIFYREGSGELQASRLADKMASAFPSQYKFSGDLHDYEITRPPYPAPPIKADGWYSMPVTMQVQTSTTTSTLT